MCVRIFYVDLNIPNHKKMLIITFLNIIHLYTLKMQIA